MKRVLVVASLSLVWALASPGWVRAQSDEVREMREQVRALLDKLNAMDARPDASSVTRQRSTHVGSSPFQLPPPVVEEPRIEVRIYDLSDLLAPVVPYPAMVTSDLGPSDQPVFPDASSAGGMVGMGMGGMGGGMMGGMGGGMGGGGMMNVLAQAAPGHSADHPPAGNGAMPARPAPAQFNGARISLDDLISAITATIDPKSWDSNGGEGTIAPLGNSLLISAMPRVHEQITRLFDTFRKRWGTLRTVSVQAHWLWLSDAQLAAVLADGQAKGQERPAFGMVNDAAWEALRKELRQADKQPAGYQAVVTCYNGQTVHAVSGSQRRVIAEMVPVVGEDKVAYAPSVTTLQEGAALQVTPMVTSAGKLVVLDLHSRVVLVRGGPGEKRLARDAAAAGKSAARDVAATIDRLNIANQHLETTLRVPVDRRILVGGMTFESQPKSGDPSLYLFVKATVQELRDDLSAVKADAKPAGSAKPAATPKRAAPPAAPAKAR